MNLVSWVIFTYDIDDHHTGTGEGTSFETIDELKLALKNGRDYYRMPYHLKVGRNVQVVDKDAPKYPSDTVKRFPGVYHDTSSQPVTVGREVINFIVTDKLIYPNDVRQTLTQKYAHTIDFDTKNQWDEKQPVYFSGVTERVQYGMRDSRTGAPTQYTLRSVNCRALNDQDIVVDTNLNQIWPTKTDTMPTVLTKLLKKTKEEIHQR